MTIAPGNLATAQDVNTQLQARLVRDANLADVPNKPAARGNLGLGGMATQNPAAVAITGGTLNNVAIGDSTAAYGQFGTLIVAPGGSFTAPPTGAFWSDDGATVLRMNDRLLVGGAADNDGAKPNVAKDWLSSIINWPVFNATAAITSRFGTIALSVASQTLNLDPIAAGTTETTIGLAAFGIANNPGGFPGEFFGAYGVYAEGLVYPGTVSNAFAAELEAVNVSGVANGTPTPYRELFLSSAQALRLGSGGGTNYIAQPAISALAIVPNGSTFNVGIVFEKGALTGADGITGFGEAIIMARGHLVSWYAAGSDGNGTRTMFVTSTITNPANAISVQAQDGGLLFLQPTNEIGFAISTVPNSVNGLGVRPSVDGDRVTFEAFGASPNVPIRIAVKGAGSPIFMETSQIIITQPGTNRSAFIQNAVTDDTTSYGIVFQDDGIVLAGVGGAVAQFVHSVDPVTSFVFANGNGSTPATMSATGGNIRLSFGGAGRLILNDTLTQGTALAGAGGALPSNADLFMQVTVNGSSYVLPLLKAS